MKKYILFFGVSVCLGLLKAEAQNQASTGQQQAAVINGQHGSTVSDSQAPAVQAGKETRSSIYTSGTGNNTTSSGNAPAPLASPQKEQPAALTDPKNGTEEPK